MSLVLGETVEHGALWMGASLWSWSAEKKREVFSGLGVTGLVSLTRRRDPDLERTVDHFLWCPVSDGLKLPDSEARRAAWVVVGWLRARVTVYVHCIAGINRSGLVTALVLREVLGLTGQQALDFVRSCRPGEVRNPVFENYLKEIG